MTQRPPGSAPDLTRPNNPLPDVAVITVPEAGRILGLGRTASYGAANRGEIPTLTLGRRRVVPVGALRRLLCLDDVPDRATDD